MSHAWQDARDAATLPYEQASGNNTVASGINSGPKNQQRLDFKNEVGIALLKYAEEFFPEPEVTSPTNPSHDY